MSTLGIVASVIQVADIGVRLSVKLLTFSHEVNHAGDSILFISKDISHTSSILRELGQSLERDHSRRRYSENAYETTHAIVKDCQAVFEEIEEMLTNRMERMGLDGTLSRPAAIAQEKTLWPFLEPGIKRLWTNLDKLKSTLLLMLNVLIYARQVAER